MSAPPFVTRVPVALTAALGVLVPLVASATIVCGCARKPERLDSAGAASPGAAATSAAVDAGHPTAVTETSSATLRLAAAVGEGAGVIAPLAAAPSLAGKTVLHVGDSMVGGDHGLTRALERHFVAEGATFVRNYKVSESIVSFDHAPTLKMLLAKHRPDIVLITLGTNEVFVPYPQALTKHVEHIVERIGARECYWLGPPTWKGDTGIVRVLRESVAPCRFFDASGLDIERVSDRVHPTDRGGAVWAQGFWAFFQNARSSAAALPTAQ